MSTFLSAVTTSSYAVHRSPVHGFGVFATSPIRAGEVILTEAPLLRLQSLTNKSDALVCGYCFRFVGSIGIQMNVLARKLNRLSNFSAEEESFPGDKRLSGVVKCGFECGEIYCSERCR